MRILFWALEPPLSQGTHKWGHRSINIDDQILALQVKLSNLNVFEQHIRRAAAYLHYLTPPLLVQMSLSSMRTNSHLQLHPSSPANAPSSDGLEDQADLTAVWKQQFLTLRDTVDTQNHLKESPGK
jgi:hypothetical protein